MEGILGDKVVAGDVVVIRYEGPKGGPGMQEMLYPTSYLKSKGLGKVCALFTDGRFSGGSSGLVIGHASPEAAEGGTIGLVEDGDVIEIDIPRRKMHLAVSDEVLARRREAMNAREKPGSRWIGSGWCRWPCRLMRRWRLRRIGGGAGSFAAQAEALRVWVLEKTAPLWRRFWVFWGLECWRFVRLLSSLLLLLCCCCWCFVERCVLALRGSPLGRGVAAARAHDRGPEPSLRTSLGGPSSSSLPPAAAAFGFLGRIEVARSRAARPRAAAFEGCGVAGAVVGGEAYVVRRNRPRAAGFCIRGGLRRGVLVVEGRALPGGECWRVLRGLLFAVHAYSSSHCFRSHAYQSISSGGTSSCDGKRGSTPPPIPGWLRRRGGARTECPGRRG